MSGALDGIKVLDLTRYAPGPYCTMILGDLGANIIKVEEAGAITGRRAKHVNKEGAPIGPVVWEFAPPDSPYDPLNRNKRSIGLNLKKTKGRRIFYQMTEKADVVVEGFRPGVVERLEVDYPRLNNINPRIIYCAITGYGQDGPYRDLAGHDINYISQGGVIGILRKPEAIPGNLLGDIVSGGMQAAIGILAALMARERTGKGQFVDISMTDGVVSLIALYLGGYFQKNRMPDEQDRVSMGAMPFYAIYQTKDGKLISIACSEPWFYANLCKALGCEEFIPYQHDPEKTDKIRAFFTQAFLTRTRDEWFEFLSQWDIAVSKVLGPNELAADPQLRHRKMIVELEHPEKGKVRQAGIAVKLSETPGSIRTFSPALGEDTEAILSELGYDKGEIDMLRGEGIISTGLRKTGE
jgi:crotonobetainyl-CoA:carnitine CoA-transferase CaiB-like acyl-CoA transferase